MNAIKAVLSLVQQRPETMDNEDILMKPGVVADRAKEMQMKTDKAHADSVENIETEEGAADGDAQDSRCH